MQQNHPYFYHVLLLTLVLACHTLQQVFSFSLHSHMLFFLVLTLSIGVFHGMLDIILLQHPPFAQKRFLIAYGLLAIIIGALVAWFFGLAIIMLLAFSVWHFGEQQGNSSQQKQSILRRVVIGASALAAAFLLGGSDIAVIITAMFSQSVWFDLTWKSWQYLSYIWVFLFGIFCCIKFYQRTFFDVDMAEIAVVWFAFLFLPPLVAFSLYFAGYHALRHIGDVLPDKTAIKTHQNALLLTALVTACLLGGVLWLISDNLVSALNAQTLFQATIVLLVAITLPHATLISFWRRYLKLKSL